MTGKSSHPIITEEPLLDRNEVAALLGISVKTVGRQQDMGKFLSGFKVGSQWRWLRSEFLLWRNAGCPNPSDWKLKRGA